MRSVGMSEQQVEQVWVRFRAGDSLSRIGRREGIPKQQVARYLQRLGGVRPVVGPVSLIWPHRDGLIWLHLRHAGDLL